MGDTGSRCSGTGIARYTLECCRLLVYILDHMLTRKHCHEELDKWNKKIEQENLRTLGQGSEKTACHGTLQLSLHPSVQWSATGDHCQHSMWSSKAQTVSTRPAALCHTAQLWFRRGPLSPCMSLSYSHSQSNTVQLDRNVCRSSGIAGNRAPYGSLGSTASPAVLHS